MPGWGQVIMLVGTGLFWLAILAVVVAAVRLPRRDPRPGPRQDPRELVAERFARGEIDEAEYRRRIDVLAGSPADAPPVQH
jgi:putative membrane protein